MPKLVTVWRQQDIAEQARHYVRAYILFPAGVVGLVCMIGGVGSLGYQFFTGTTYSWTTFVASTGLLMIGAVWGWIQARYHRYLLAQVPEVFAARMRVAVARTSRKAKATPEAPPIEHLGRRFVPLAYMAGLATIFGASFAAFMQGSLDAVPAALMPWAGFYWAKLFSWRGVIK